MLSENQMVAVRNAIEKMYIGTCTITEYQKVVKANKSTGFQEVVMLENQPCRLSFEKIAKNVQGESASSLVQTAKVFIAPEIEVKAGSKLTIVQNGITTEYKNSSVPAMYSTHQEIILDLFEGWS